MREHNYANAKHEFDTDRVVRHPRGHRGKGPFVSTEYWITAQIFATDVASKLQKSLPQLHKEIKRHWGGKPSHGGPDNSAYYPYPVKEYPPFGPADHSRIPTVDRCPLADRLCLAVPPELIWGVKMCTCKLTGEKPMMQQLVDVKASLKSNFGAERERAIPMGA
ncbi:hypothetical protein L873DRAFT_1794643 [Choiromyces venosus 120613-1]|uniref:Uncharacterized protein n=1 Tax=Choiromyces venosus 120613-1 TaxID=1336337 RepID=A0A3N4J5M2_9PEZI|nr:hypothetical protein L873DRAFT_1794643 [Choiromyces venosus 120613-1]